MKQLPEKYYLTHFEEFIHYIESSSAHLLNDKCQHFIAQFRSLDHNAKCMLVRVLNRKSAFVERTSLQYQEIENPNDALNELRRAKFIARINKHTFSEFITNLNKQALIELAQVSHLDKPNKSAKKDAWFNFVNHQIQYDEVKKHAVTQSFYYFNLVHDFQYLLFVYFGHLGGALNQFSMRDLGIMKTRTQSNRVSAHFDSMQDAQSAFFHCQQYASCKNLPADQAPLFAEQLLKCPQPYGTLATEKYHHTLYKTALQLENSDALYLTLLSKSEHPSAVEKLIREKHKLGEHDFCKTHLSEIIKEPPSETLLLFAQDFLARKYHKKRTSILTDMLKSGPTSLGIDEAYIGSVEHGVKDYYARQGVTSYFSENKLWRALFALTFWFELFEHEKSGHHNGFSYLPYLLQENRFYSELGDEIEATLARFENTQTWLTHIAQMCEQHKGQATGLFSWQAQLHNVLCEFIQAAPTAALINQLRKIAQNFKQYSDGYPDLVVFKEDGVYLEEIKSPGDSLRRNQLITIQSLIESGFKVVIQATHWQVDPNQSYVVVDIETTGGKKEHHRITEVGMVRIENGNIVDTWQSLVNPMRHIPNAITQLTGIDDAMVKDAPVFADLANEIAKFTQGAIFVAHNVNFDFGFIKQEFARLNQPYHRAKLCTVKLARKHLPGHASYSLGKLCHSLNITLENHHRALDDAQAAAQILLLVNKQRV